MEKNEEKQPIELFTCPDCNCQSGHVEHCFTDKAICTRPACKQYRPIPANDFVNDHNGLPITIRPAHITKIYNRD